MLFFHLGAARCDQKGRRKLRTRKKLKALSGMRSNCFVQLAPAVGDPDLSDGQSSAYDVVVLSAVEDRDSPELPTTDLDCFDDTLLDSSACSEIEGFLEEYEQIAASPDFQHSSGASSPDNPEPLTQPVILEALDDLSVTCVEIAEHLTSLGLRQHLLFAVDRTEAHMRTIINRFSLLLEWLLDTKPSFKKYSLCTLQLCIKTFITEEYGHITDYVKYLSDYKHYQCSTVISHLDDIRLVFTIVILFRLTLCVRVFCSVVQDLCVLVCSPQRSYLNS